LRNFLKFNFVFLKKNQAISLDDSHVGVPHWIKFVSHDVQI